MLFLPWYSAVRECIQSPVATKRFWSEFRRHSIKYFTFLNYLHLVSWVFTDIFNIYCLRFFPIFLFYYLWMWRKNLLQLKSRSLRGERILEIPSIFQQTQTDLLRINFPTNCWLSPIEMKNAINNPIDRHYRNIPKFRDIEFSTANSHWAKFRPDAKI